MDPPDARGGPAVERHADTAPRRARITLRARVALACLVSAFLVLAVAGASVTAVLTHQQDDRLDRQLASVVRVVRPALATEAADRRPRVTTNRERLARQVARASGTAYAAVAVRDGAVVASAGTATLSDAGQLARSRPGLVTVSTDDGTYRVRTVPGGVAGDLLISVGIPTEPAEQQIRDVRRSVLIVGLLAVLVAAALGWVAAGPALRPLRDLVDRVRSTGQRPSRAPWRRGAPEIDEVADALDDLDARLAVSQARERQALEAARGFAAAAGHELRTPLATMSTDLAVLAAHPQLPADDRDDVIASLRRGQERLQVTLESLEQLARGELLDDTALVPTDLTGLLHQLADEVSRHERVTVRADVSGEPLMVRLWPPGMRLLTENLVRNAARHGRADRVWLSLQQRHGSMWLIVDDDGTGVPTSEHERVLARFARGSTAVGSGSGLGLALVQQQATLHGWTLTLADSPRGGLRLVLGPLTEVG